MTPLEIVRAARLWMGAIDVDPASCEIANKGIGAVRYYTKETNGFNRQWGGAVFLNPPGGLCDHVGREVLPETKTRKSCTETGACGLAPGHEHHGVTSSAKAWWWKLVDNYLAGNTQRALFVAFSVELLQTTQVKAPAGKPLPLDFPICFPRKRIAFWVERRGLLTPGKSPTHSSCLIGLPDAGAVRSSTARFVELFSQFGKVVA
jgi:hypothetical protein